MHGGMHMYTYTTDSLVRIINFNIKHIFIPQMLRMYCDVDGATLVKHPPPSR
jgi:hypothetical protein